MSNQAVSRYQAAGLRKLGFFGDPISFTRQQLRNLFKNAKEEDLKSLAPKERELLERLYGSNDRVEYSYPTIKSVAADLNVDKTVAGRRHQLAMQKLLHTKREIRIAGSLSPTSEQVEFMHQKSPLEARDKVAKDMVVTVGVVRRWIRQQRIESRPQGRPRISLPPEVLEFIKANYLEMSIVAMAKLTGYGPEIIARSLRGAGIPIGNTTR